VLRSLLSALGIYKIYSKWLLDQIKTSETPMHIGVITDGNRRWATSHDMIPWEGHHVGADTFKEWATSHDMIPWEGHHVGADTFKEFLNWCIELNIKTITVYSFSTENFERSKEEVEELMKLFERTLEDVIISKDIHEHRVRVHALGRTTLLPEKVQVLIKKVEEVTQDYDNFYLNIAVAYGGRAEIIDATKKIAEKVVKGDIKINEINEEYMAQHLYTSHLPQPDPDLIIRTSGESRLSNFLVWQSAYSELFIVDVYWPAFRKIDFMRTIRSYQQRKRRFGK